MADEKKFLDQAGVQYLWSQLSLQDYPNNETLIAVLNAIDDTKADKDELDAAIAAIPIPDVSGQINEHNISTEAHADIRASIDVKQDIITELVGGSVPSTFNISWSNGMWSDSEPGVSGQYHYHKVNDFAENLTANDITSGVTAYVSEWSEEAQNYIQKQYSDTVNTFGDGYYGCPYFIVITKPNTNVSIYGSVGYHGYVSAEMTFSETGVYFPAWNESVGWEWAHVTNVTFNYNKSNERMVVKKEHLPDDLATESYVTEQIAAIPTPDVSGQINIHNISPEAHADIRASINAKQDIITEIAQTIGTKTVETSNINETFGEYVVLTTDIVSIDDVISIEMSGDLVYYGDEGDYTQPFNASIDQLIKYGTAYQYSDFNSGYVDINFTNEGIKVLCEGAYIDMITVTYQSTVNSMVVKREYLPSDLATTTDITSATIALKNELLNGAGEAYDTLKELGDLIDENTDALSVLETVASSKQDKLMGTEGQIVTFDADGNVIVVDCAGADEAIAMLAECEVFIPAQQNGITYANSDGSIFVI